MGGAIALAGLSSCGSSTIAPATVYVLGTIGPGSGSSPCQEGTVTQWLQVGSVQSGVSMVSDPNTTVTCSVTSSGSDSFAVSIVVTAEGSSFNVEGTMPKSGTGTGITSAGIEGSSMGTPIAYSSMGNCNVVMANNAPGTTTPGYDPSTGPPIAGGRVWATVTCPAMTISGQPGVCAGVLTFRMENCVGSPQS